jgi:hypothetical protein
VFEACFGYDLILNDGIVAETLVGLQVKGKNLLFCFYSLQNASDDNCAQKQRSAKPMYVYPNCCMTKISNEISQL